MKAKATINTLKRKKISLSKKIMELPPKKRTDENKLITKILAYSARKMRANPAAPYSILNPDTSSDSPSAKSNGARFVSATQVTNHIKKPGSIIKANQIRNWDSASSVNLKLPTKNKGNRRTRAILISYEIV